MIASAHRYAHSLARNAAFLEIETLQILQKHKGKSKKYGSGASTSASLHCCCAIYNSVVIRVPSIPILNHSPALDILRLRHALRRDDEGEKG